MTEPALISDEWLKSVGFKWHQFDRQPEKHWVLWLGGAMAGRHSFTSFEDLGIELATCAYRNLHGDLIAQEAGWFCWLRDDAAGRYHRFIHIRHLHTQRELIAMVEGLTGQTWDPENHLYGNLYRPEVAARLRMELERADRRLTLGADNYSKWSDIEKDDTRGRALPEHMQVAEDVRGKS